MTNKELIEKLKEFPEDMEVLVSVNGSKYTEPTNPRKRFMDSSQKYYIGIDPNLLPH